MLPLRAGEVLEGVPTDDNVVPGVVGDGQTVHLYTLQAGTNHGGNCNIVESFALPYLAPGQTITAATISFYLNAQIPAPASNPNYNLSLYGLNRVSTTVPNPLATDYYIGTTDTANALLTSSFCTPTNPLNSVVSYSGANLVSFINTQRANTAFVGQDLSSTRYIFFRINANADIENNGVANYEFGSARNPIRTEHPMLALTVSGGISNVAGRLQFSFNLPNQAVTSAGVYNPTTGVLVRTLWNNVQYSQGLNYGYWDGNDDNGNALPTGTNYQIKMIYHNVQYIWDGMVGNTSASQSGADVYRSFSKIHDMAINGTQAFYAVGYNELGAPFHTFTVGAPQVPSALDFGYNLCDPYSALYYVASDATKTYWAKVYGGLVPPYQPGGGATPTGTTTGVGTYIIAINKSDNSFYTFPKGTAMAQGSFQIYPSCVDYDATLNQPYASTGIAVQQSGNCLFVSHRNLNVVRVFDKVQGNLLGSFTVSQPGRLACTANGDVWVTSDSTTSPAVYRYTFANGTATLDKTLTGFSAPAGVGVSADDTLVLVTDGGTSQQIKAFNNATGAAAWTYGTLGGNPAGNPAVSSTSFDFYTQEANSALFSTEAFVAFQPDNTFWVQDGGNGRVVHYSINGNALVYIEQISYVDASYRATVDSTDATRVFNNFMEYSVDYSLPLGGTNGSWKMVRNWSVGLPSDATHNYFGYANGWASVVTMSNGRTYGFLSNIYNNNWDLFELPATGPARYTGYTFPQSTNPLLYSDSSLRYNVENGANTTIQAYSQPLTGFDINNNPVWGSPEQLTSITLNPAVDPSPWSAYPLRTEVTAGGIFVDFGGFQDNTGNHIGGIPVGTSKFLWESGKSVNGSYWFPQDGAFDIADGVNYAGNYAEALGRNIVYGYHGELWKGGEACQWVNYLDNGLMVGRFGTYADTLVADVTTDGYAGNSFSSALVHGPNNTVFFYSNDESNHGGSIRWEIKGWDDITELDGSGAVGSIASLSANTAGPVVLVTSPTTGAVYSNGSNLNLSAEAASSGASIASIQFLDGTTSLGTVTAPPFVLATSGLTSGSHVITAKATDSAGLSASSPPVSITVGSDGLNAPPPAPVSLSSSDVTSTSATLSWTEPAIGTTSSTIGQIVSFQFDSATDSGALKPTDVAGAAPYATSNWNLLGTGGTVGLQFINPVNNAGMKLTNLGEYLGISGSDDTHSTQSLTGTALKLFSTEVTTQFSPSVAVTISGVPFASYDVVAYNLPSSISDGPQTASVTVSNNTGSSVVQQSFNKLPTGCTTSAVAFGSNASVSNINAVAVQGISGPKVEIQGNNLAGFQIVERPYDQGTPTSYTILRATGTSGTFASIGTATGSATSFTDTSSLSASTTYQYKIEAVDSFGTSAASNVVTVTTPAAPQAVTTSFAAWQSQYFTADQLTDPTISGPTADPYGSGVPNLLAYALQLNPATARPTDVPSPTITNGHLTVTYFQPNSIADITYIVEVSPNLLNWNSGAGYTQVISSVPSATGTTVTIQDALPAATQKHFMRLRVTQN